MFKYPALTICAAVVFICLAQAQGEVQNSTTGPVNTVSATTDKKPVEPTKPPTPQHCNVGDRKAVEHSCKDYQECDKNYKWINKTCTVMCKVFEPKSSKCVWNWQFPCMKPPTTVAPPTTKAVPTTPTTTTTTKAPVCTNGDTQIIPKDCKNYYLCKSGQWTKTYCSYGYDFDRKKKTCIWSWWADC